MLVSLSERYHGSRYNRTIGILLALFLVAPLPAEVFFETGSFAVLADTQSVTSFGRLSYSDDQEVGKGFSLAIGQRWKNNWAIEAQWLYSDSTAEGTVSGMGFPLSVNQQLEVNAGLIAVGKTFLPLGEDSSWSVSLVGSIGILHMQNTATLFTMVDQMRAADTDTGGVWQIDLRSTFTFNNDWSTGISLRYLKVADLSFSASGITQELKNTKALLIGPFVRFQF
jgi:hypothetical protein